MKYIRLTLAALLTGMISIAFADNSEVTYQCADYIKCTTTKSKQTCEMSPKSSIKIWNMQLPPYVGVPDGTYKLTSAQWIPSEKFSGECFYNTGSSDIVLNTPLNLKSATSTSLPNAWKFNGTEWECSADGPQYCQFEVIPPSPKK